MTTGAAITIDPAETFLHLTRAPIVEAVIDLRSRAAAGWDEARVTHHLRDALPDYPNVQSLRTHTVTAHFSHADASMKLESPASTRDNDGWIGVRLLSADGLQIATFERDGFGFSRLKPYPDWKAFSQEALRLWEIHAALAGLSEVQRLGVRCINRFEVPIADLRFDDYLKYMSGSPLGFSNSGFLYHDVLAVPGYPYAVNLVRTMQPPETTDALNLGLVVDVDVFSTAAFPLKRDTIESRLTEMHWLRNKVFFDSVTDRTVKLCQ